MKKVVFILIRRSMPFGPSTILGAFDSKDKAARVLLNELKEYAAEKHIDIPQNEEDLLFEIKKDNEANIVNRYNYRIELFHLNFSPKQEKYIEE